MDNNIVSLLSQIEEMSAHFCFCTVKATGPLICFTLLIADFSNFDRFVLGPQINNRTGIATEDVPRQGPSVPQVSAKSAERLLSYERKRCFKNVSFSFMMILLMMMMFSLPVNL